MDSYKISWKRSALKELYKIRKEYISRIIKAVEELSSNPLPTGVKKLTGSERTYRLRVGNYRVIYELFEEKLIIHIVRIRHRREVYR
jgi:mRNA interferase RelE/StbE